MPKLRNRSHLDRANKAEANATAALGLFEVAAADLDYAAQELDGIAAEARAEADHLALVSDDASVNAQKRREQATAIRNLLGFA